MQKTADQCSFEQFSLYFHIFANVTYVQPSGYSHVILYQFAVGICFLIANGTLKGTQMNDKSNQVRRSFESRYIYYYFVILLARFCYQIIIDTHEKSESAKKIKIMFYELHLPKIFACYLLSVAVSRAVLSEVLSL